MDNIPNDIILLIFNNIKLITDKRQFLRTCKRTNNITKKLMEEYENNYEIEYFDKIKKYCVEKFTLELCHDKYFHLIPKTYLSATNEIIGDALAFFGNIDLLKILQKNKNKLLSRSLFGHTTVIDCCFFGESEYGNDSGCLKERFYERTFGTKCDIRFISNVCALASHNGNINILEYFLSIEANINWLSPFMAAKNGQLDTLKWLQKNNCKFNHYVPAIASLYGHHDVLEWLIKNNCKINHLTGEFAGRKGNVNILELLKEYKYELSYHVSNKAAEYGNVNVLEWLKENHYIIDNETNDFAAAHGHLNVLIWLKENGFKSNNTSCIEAAYSGHLDIIKWLLENDYELDRYQVLEIAISYDYFHIFEWLINNGYGLDKHEICDMALSYQNTIIIEWLARNNYKWNKENINSVNDLIENNHKETLNWARNIQNMINK